MKTYSMVGLGNFGPFHPMHDPRVNVYVENKRVHTAPNAVEGHLWAIREGYQIDDEKLRASNRYQELLAQVRYERSGL
jgi:hypothetical protein